MQENNFETIISKWRRLSAAEQVEQKELVALPSMSGDSSSQQTFNKKEDESNLIVPERSGTLPVVITGAGVGAGAVPSSDISPDIVNKDPDEKQNFIKHDSDDSKEQAGDTNDNDKKSDKDYIENNKIENQKTKTEKGKLCDNVDSVFLRSPPPHKTRSNASTTNNEEEDCGIKCLYYTLQCCDCTII